MEIINVTDEIIEINVTEAVVNVVTQTGAYPLPSNVFSVFGRVGNVVGQAGDYNTDLVGEGLINKYYTDARSRAAISENITGLEYSSASGIFSLASGYVIPQQSTLDAKVPYTGATGEVNLGSYDLYVNELTIGKGTNELSNNTALGHQALFHITTGNYNTGIGHEALHNTSTGAYNTALGQSAMFTNTTGGQNTALGLNALLYNTSGSSNVAVGLDTLQHNTTGASNTAIGYNAGSHITGGATPNTTSSSSVYIGRDTKAKADGASNEIVIGYNAVGNGSNTATIGNGSITANYFSGSMHAGSYVKNGGTSVEFLKADGSVDSTTYTSQSRTISTTAPLTGGGDLSANRTLAINQSGASADGYLSSTDWNTFNGKQPLISAGTTAQYYRGDKTFQTLNTLAVPENTNLYYTQARFNTAFGGKTTTDLAEGTNLYFTTARAQAAISGTLPISVSGGVVSISQASGSSNGYLSSTDWNTFNAKQAALNGTGFVKISGTTISYDNSTYLTTISGITAGGELSGTYANPSLVNSAVTGKILSGVNITGGTIADTDSILTAFGKLQNQINGLIGSSIYEGTWNASTNTPSLASGVGTQGSYYIVSVAGSTNIDGITDWNVGDWIIFDGTAWQQVDNTDAVVSVNGETGAVSLTTSNITEGTNLYFTNARGIGSTLTGYTSGSGVVAATDTILQAIQKINGNVSGLVTGVSSVFGRTGAVVAASGDYNTSQVTENTNLYYTQGRFDTAFSAKSTTNLTEGTNLYYTSARFDTAFSGKSTTNLTEGTNLYYTEARVDANANVAANTAARHAAVTLGTANGLSLSTQALSLAAASTSTTGALTSTDWNTFNGKQAALNGTGFVKISGTTISYDNSTYLTTSAASSTYLALSGGTLTGALSGTSATFSGDVTATGSGFQGRYARIYEASAQRGGFYPYNIISGGGTDYSIGLFSESSLWFAAGGGVTKHLTIASTGAATFSSSVQAIDLIAQRTVGADAVGGSIILSRNNLSAYRAGAIFSYYYAANAAGNQDTLSFGVSSDTTSPATVGKVKMVITEAGNVGIGTSNPIAKLQINGSRIFQNGNSYGNVETQFAYSAFTNPVVSIFTHTSGAAYAQETIKVTIFQNGVSNGYGNVQVGYAVIGNNPYTPTTWVSSVIVQGGNIGNVGTLSWSGNTLQYTCNRATNYDNYAIIVEWASTNSDSSPTYPNL